MKFIFFLIFGGSLFYFLSVFDNSRREVSIINDSRFCGEFIRIYEKRTSRSPKIYKYLDVKNESLIKSFRLENEKTGLNNLILNKKICINYYESFLGDNIAINIVVN